MNTTTTTTGRSYRPYFWDEFTSAPAPRGDGGQSLPAWAERGLRSLRDGLGREPGSVPSMRQLHRVRPTDADRNADRLPASYRAEHAVLTLFGLHQTGAAHSAHRPGVGLGTACRGLRGSLSEAAVRRRLAAAATAQDLDELVQHLRGIVPLLRQADTGLDYTRLYRDLCDWLTPRHTKVLRAWGLQYTDPTGAPAETRADGPQGAKPRTADQPLWATFDPKSGSAGADLAALRSGLGAEAGTVPAMWRFYRTSLSTELRAKGALTRDLVAEHTALALFGVHQHGRRVPMHTHGVSPGAACHRLLARDGQADRTAIERRLGVLLTSLDGEELAHHLRGLVTLLRAKDIGLDYDALRRALRHWDDSEGAEEQSRIRSRWDRDFRVGDAPPRD
ncbi:type I-E CRISPR-associated protein Cse2/CasB [Actinacidiphila yeochonensis]|uniref:type I-E CRISPR-associated protein Cse2/CasB n=1 Tax=Actinacidiphila yeochonensis TaxID=89050 RepID=UPI00056089F0|nr:type I-E CRISPR-associated protein Cse2/CasB [Actinacidiphila yeochonensis]